MIIHYKLCALLLGFLMVISETAFSAQSTSDVSVTEEIERASLENVLGSRVESLKTSEPYVIGQGDILSVSVFGEGDMAAARSVVNARPSLQVYSDRVAESGVKVMLDGRISLKHIGDVEVVGLTLTELADHLKNLYKTVYTEPIITTTLVQSNSLRYTIMGNVARPGIFYLDLPLNLVQAIARSGGFTEWANKEMTIVRDQINNGYTESFKDNTMKFDFDRFESGKDVTQNISIRSGDIIIVH